MGAKKPFFFKSSSQQVLCMSNGVRGKEQKKFSKNFHFSGSAGQKTEK